MHLLGTIMEMGWLNRPSIMVYDGTTKMLHLLLARDRNQLLCSSYILHLPVPGAVMPRVAATGDYGDEHSELWRITERWRRCAREPTGGGFILVRVTKEAFDTPWLGSRAS